jgi:hypothetical protein
MQPGAGTRRLLKKGNGHCAVHAGSDNPLRLATDVAADASNSTGQPVPSAMED